MTLLDTMRKARYTTHTQLEDRGYWIINKKNREVYQTEETFNKYYNYIDISNVEELSGYYINDKKEKIWIYCSFNAFIKDHITYLLHCLIKEAMEFHILSWVQPKPLDIPTLKEFNQNHVIELVQISEHVADCKKHFFSVQYELIPVEDEEEILNELMIRKNSLPCILSSDVQLHVRGMFDITGRIVRIVYECSISYAHVVSNQVKKKEARFL